MFLSTEQIKDPQHAATSRPAPLVIPVVPLPGELLPELVLRAAAVNSYRKSGNVLSAAGIVVGGNLSIAARAQGREEDLAITLGTPGGQAALQRIIPYPIPGRPGWTDFFGIPLRAVHRDMRHRRVSPRSLRQSLHLKAIWSVKIFNFDPRTKERLLSGCPECARKPTYLRTFGLQYCEFCCTDDDFGFRRGRVDFRDYPQPILEVDDMEALDFVTDLIDPQRQRDCVHRGRLHGDLNNFDPTDVFELVVAIARALTCSSFLKRSCRREDYTRITPEVLTTAGRAILNWPDGFNEIVEEVRAAAPSRSGFYGMKKELGPLVGPNFDNYLPFAMRLQVQNQLKQNTKSVASALITLPTECSPPSNFIPIWDAAPRFNVSSKRIRKLIRRGHVSSFRIKDAKKSPVLVNSRDLGAVLELDRSTMEARSVAVRLGIPRPFLKDLVEKGFILPVARRNIDLGDEFFSKRSVEQLMGRCRAMERGDSPPTGAVRIGRAICQLRLGPRAPWGGIVERILKAEVEIWPTTHTLSIANYAIRNRFCLADLPLSNQPIEDDVILSQGEAAACLNTSATRVNQLVRAGLLSAHLTVRELREFSEDYAFTSEAIEMLVQTGIKMRMRDLLPILRSRGIEPHATVNGSRGYVWRRAEICAIR